ncbi:putative quinol monooxygenase [Vibrio sp.]|uniref:putative quinol monooxygenase n=1 Tax=Vibrio sp. TaxID=678 RepID=UPI003D0D23A2
MTGKVILSGYILVPDAERHIVVAALAPHIELTRAEKGCLVFQVSQNQENRQRFDVYEEFVDQTAFDLHQERVKQSYWGKVTKGVTRHYQITRQSD